MTDISAVPAEWLEAFDFVVCEDDDDRIDPDTKFTRSIESIYRMREIERRDGIHYTFASGEVRAELIRRGLREAPPEVMAFTEARRILADGLDVPVTWANLLLRQLPTITVRGKKRWLAEDVRKAAGEASDWSQRFLYWALSQPGLREPAPQWPAAPSSRSARTPRPTP